MAGHTCVSASCHCPPSLPTSPSSHALVCIIYSLLVDMYCMVVQECQVAVLECKVFLAVKSGGPGVWRLFLSCHRHSGHA